MTTVAPRDGVIYGLSCTCHPEDGIRYVGLTVQALARRLNRHIRDSRLAKNANLPISNWIRKHGGSRISMQVIDKGESGRPLQRLEVWWIAFMRRVRGGKILNVSNGGYQPAWTRAGRLRVSGRSNHQAVISENDVLTISQMMSDGITPKEISKNTSISESTIRGVLTGKSWKHVERPSFSFRKNLNESEVRQLYAKASSGSSNRQLAEEYEVSEASVRAIVSGRSFRHLDLTPLHEPKPKVLTDEVVVGVHQLYASGRFSQSVLSRRFGLSQSSVWRIINGQVHKHLQLPPLNTPGQGKWNGTGVTDETGTKSQ